MRCGISIFKALLGAKTENHTYTSTTNSYEQLTLNSYNYHNPSYRTLKRQKKIYQEQEYTFFGIVK